MDFEEWMVEAIKPTLWLQSLGISQFMPMELEQCDDWTFVIKWHALLEASASHFLTAQFGNIDLSDVFSRLAMSDIRTGKYAFLRATGVLLKEELLFIRTLSELRNDLVHDIQMVNYSIKEGLDKLDPKPRKAKCRVYGYDIMDRRASFNGSSKDEDKLKWIEENPKKAIGWSCSKLMEKLCRRSLSPTLHVSAVKEYQRMVEDHESKHKPKTNPPSQS